MKEVDSITERTGITTETYGCKLHDETQYLGCAICDVERLESEAIAMRLRIENDALRLERLRELLRDTRDFYWGLGEVPFRYRHTIATDLKNKIDAALEPPK